MSFFDILLLIFLALAINCKVFIEFAFNFFILGISHCVMFLLTNSLNFSFFSSLLTLFCVPFWISLYNSFLNLLFNVFLIVFFCFIYFLEILSFAKDAFNNLFIHLIFYLLYSIRKNFLKFSILKKCLQQIKNVVCTY